MKKLFIITLSLLSFGAYAQEDSSEPLTSKRGIPILPEAGEWAIGIDAEPILRYVGNFFNGSTNENEAPGFNSSGGGANLMGKLMKDANNAYRVRFALNRESASFKNLVYDDVADDGSEVEDKGSVSALNIYLGGGLEKRRGKGRLQGIYGAEAGIGFSSGSAKFDYGNAYTASNTSPTTTDFDYDYDAGDLYIEEDGSSGAGSRMTKETSGTSISFRLSGFIGVEYFIAPKVSLGGEIGYGLSLSSAPKGSSTSETWNGSAVETTDSDFYSEGGSFNIGTMPTGSIYFFFYF